MNSTEPVSNDTITDTESQSLKKECCGIYGLRNKINNKWYVGQSFNILTRWDKAYRRMHCKSQLKIYAALKKYGYEMFEKVVLEECKPDLEILNKREVFWVTKLDSIDNGYNIHPGGGRVAKHFSFKGYRHSVEAIAKIKEARKGKSTGPRTQQTKNKISAGLAGKIKSNTHRENLSISLRGRCLSSAHKHKISQSLQGNGLGKENSCYKSGRTFQEVSEKMKKVRAAREIKRKLHYSSTPSVQQQSGARDIPSSPNSCWEFPRDV